MKSDEICKDWVWLSTNTYNMLIYSFGKGYAFCCDAMTLGNNTQIRQFWKVPLWQPENSKANTQPVLWLNTQSAKLWNAAHKTLIGPDFGAKQGLHTKVLNTNKLGWAEPHSRFPLGFPLKFPYEIWFMVFRNVEKFIS